ncbi:sulfate adenylyltransferase, large subunit [Methylocella silvestris BL2]|uniref:Multifunctional fusion protein n=1 Tax=Methylocella silvestris (strain DSM 15510 / CIP 108128 / LMG 27833 / NCIMB 13906 / BL2) TaxID=395965 RepID=B8ELU5_METSB|nr:sulfate adenylyltransferase subunit CysN [Methylocella silvestris]ACK50726.1 sulfate adenylyltransferase, large subunit [Methylocella silvestris BL2]
MLESVAAASSGGLSAQAEPSDAAPPPTLRLITCGSVDDGKSTLIGRLLFEQSLIFDDQFAALERDSKRHGTTGDDIDFALLVDGLEAEREQGITIDVAYRYVSTPRRAFIIADTPGHEQYTRNMATAASSASLAILLVDARKGLLTQTCRHAAIVSLIGIKHVVLAVNKIDLTGFDEAGFHKIVADFKAFAATLGFASITPIPISARHGDNVSEKSSNTPWHKGPALLSFLETVDVEEDQSAKPFRFPVQWVNRPHLDFRGFAGTIASGSVRPGDEIVVAGSGKISKVARIVAADGDLASAGAGEAVTLTLEDELDIARGDLLSDAKSRPEVSDQFAAHLIWMSEDKLMPGRSYLLKSGAKTVPVTVTELKHRIDVNTLGELPARTLSLNEVGVCNLATATPIAFDPYTDNHTTGSFILIDRATNATAAAGLISFGLRRATNIHRHGLSIGKLDRARLNNQKPAVLWFTGLSGSGKSTISNLVESWLYAHGMRTILLDGDNIRHGLNKNLGFTEVDRVENIRRVGEVAKLMTDAGLIVLCSFISPFNAERQLVRDLLDDGEFLEIFVDTPIEDCIARDPKGLYKKALAGEIKNFTGVDQRYEAPQNPEMIVARDGQTPQQAAAAIVKELIRRGFIDSFADPGDDFSI